MRKNKGSRSLMLAQHIDLRFVLFYHLTVHLFSKYYVHTILGTFLSAGRECSCERFVERTGIIHTPSIKINRSRTEGGSLVVDKGILLRKVKCI